MIVFFVMILYFLHFNLNSVRHLGREVKAADSKSAGLCPRRFESCRCRTFLPHYSYVRVQWPSGLRRSTQVRVSSEAWVRTPPEPHLFFIEVQP